MIKTYKIAKLEKEIKKLKMYIHYITEYPDTHDIQGCYPVCYNEWLDNEYQLIELKNEKINRKRKNTN